MKINQFIATAALLVSSAVANPWIECGIGSVMESPFEKQFALSNPDICANKETAAAKLINDTHASLEVETARGQGEKLTALMNILEIYVEQQASFSATLRNEYSSIVASPAYLTLSKTEKAQAYYNTVLSVYINI